MKLWNPFTTYRNILASEAADDDTIAIQREIFDSGEIPIVDFSRTQLSLD